MVEFRTGESVVHLCWKGYCVAICFFFFAAIRAGCQMYVVFPNSSKVKMD
jgi:hypothetical protein